MADVELNILLKAQDYIDGLKGTVEELENLKSGHKDATDEMVNDVGRLEKRYEQLKAEQKAAYDQWKKTFSGQDSRKLSEVNKELRQTEEQLEATTEKTEDFGEKTEEATVEVEKASKSHKNYASVMRKAALILAALGAAVTFFKKVMASTNDTAQRFNVFIKQAGAVSREFLQSVADKNFEDFGKRLKEAATNAKAYANAQALLQARTLKTNSTIDKLSLQVAEYRDILEDTNLSEKERQGILDEIYAKELYIAGERRRLAEEKVNTELKNSKLSRQYTKDEIDAMIDMSVVYQENRDVLQKYVDAQDGIIKGQKKVAEIEANTPQNLKDIAEGYRLWAKDGGETLKEISGAMGELTQAQIAEYGVVREVAEKSNEALEKQKKAYEEVVKAAMKAAEELAAAYQESLYQDMSPTERIEADRKYQLQQIQLLEDTIKKAGSLTQEQGDMLKALRDATNARAAADTAAFHAEELEAQKQYDAELREEIRSTAEQIRDIQRETRIEALDLAGGNEKQKLGLEIEFLKEDIGALAENLIAGKGDEVDEALYEFMLTRLKNLEKQKDALSKEFSMWDLIDPNGNFSQPEREKLEQAFAETINNVVGILDGAYALRVADAERTRSLIDEQIAMTQDQLEAEMELMKAGYASNVDAKRKELEELKKQREKALKEEEKALKAQQTMQSVMQMTSLITASAEIFKSLSPLGPIGIIAAVASIASMFAAFAAAKVQAAKAAKLEKGGFGDDMGIISGRRHAQGGERFSDHIEVEGGEAWGVLSRPATRKYGKAFHEIVNNFNRDNLVIDRPDYMSNVVVDVNQTNERLDRVQGELIKLNRHFGVSAEVIETPTARIIKRGNKTRIIRK